MNSTSLTKPVDLQGLSLALAKTKADYEAKIDNINSKPFYVEITDDMESEEEFAWLSDKTYSEIDFINNDGVPVYFRYGDYEGKAIKDYDGNFYAMCFDFTSSTDTLMGVRIEIDSGDNVNVINDINIPNITSIPQSDWNETDTTDNDYILNKPAIRAGEGENSIVEGQLVKSSSAAIYTLYITGEANTKTFTYTTEDNFATLQKNYIFCLYNTRYYSVADINVTEKTISFNKVISNSALSNVEVKIYYQYKDALKAYAHSEGQVSAAAGGSSHAEGSITKALGLGSHSEGLLSIAEGQDAHAEGNNTLALGTHTHSEGTGTIATASAQHTQGRFNIKDINETYAHIVGNGTSDNNRSNAHTLDWSGNGWYAGKLTVGTAPTNDMDVATKKYVDDATAGITSDLSGLTDTTIVTPTDGQLLRYNSTTSKWENVTLSLAISSNVIQLKEGNTVISSVTLPIYNGGVSS